MIRYLTEDYEIKAKACIIAIGWFLFIVAKRHTNNILIRYSLFGIIPKIRTNFSRIIWNVSGNCGHQSNVVYRSPEPKRVVHRLMPAFVGPFMNLRCRWDKISIGLFHYNCRFVIGWPVFNLKKKTGSHSLVGRGDRLRLGGNSLVTVDGDAYRYQEDMTEK